METLISTTLAILLGAFLTLFTQLILTRFNHDLKKKETLLNLYSDWISAIEISYSSYICNTGGAIPYKHIESKIKILESDNKKLQQIQKIHDTFPDIRSDEYEEIRMDAHTDPNWDDPKFRSEINTLIKLIKGNF